MNGRRFAYVVNREINQIPLALQLVTKTIRVRVIGNTRIGLVRVRVRVKNPRLTVTRT
jgi:hypothetical protein